MTCEECGHALKVDPRAVRRYTLGGLPHIELHGVTVTQCPSCGAEDIGIPRIEQWHRVLAMHFINQSRMLAPSEVRFLRKQIGLSTIDFAGCMGVARETVTRWETGATPIGAVADRFIRLLVATYTPASDYEAKDALSGIDSSRPAPKRLATFALKASADGWRPERAGVAA